MQAAVPRGGEGVAEGAAAVASVADEDTGARQGVEHECGAPVVAHPIFGQQHDQRPPPLVAGSVQLGVQAAFGPPDTTGNIPFLSMLAAVRRAFRWVLSIMIASGSPA